MNHLILCSPVNMMCLPTEVMVQLEFISFCLIKKNISKTSTDWLLIHSFDSMRASMRGP